MSVALWFFNRYCKLFTLKLLIHTTQVPTSFAYPQQNTGYMTQQQASVAAQRQMQMMSSSQPQQQQQQPQQQMPGAQQNMPQQQYYVCWCLKI